MVKCWWWTAATLFAADTPARMSWRVFTLQSIAFVLLTWLAGQYFIGQQDSRLEDVREQLAAATARLDQRLDKLERYVREIGSAPSVAAGQQTAPPDSAATLTELSQRIEVVEGREQELRKKLAGLLRRQHLLAQSQPEHLRVQSWMAGLDPEKRAAAQAAYRAELERMQSVFPATPDAPPPSPEDMLRLLEESRERLKLHLQGILSGEDYQAFLSSLEEGEIPLGLPPLNAQEQ